MKKKFFAVLFISLLLLNCKKTAIFIDIDYSLEELKDAYPASFQGRPVEFLDRHRKVEGMKIDEFKFGHYDNKLAFTIYLGEDKETTKANWKKLVKEIKNNDDLTDYNDKSASESHFEYISRPSDQQTFAGIAWTKKRFLFHIETDDEDKLKEFLKTTIVAKVQ